VGFETGARGVRGERAASVSSARNRELGRAEMFAIETATDIPRALKLCVGLSDSSLTQRSTSSANFDARRSGVPPSPNDIGSTPAGNGSTSR